MAIDLSVDYRRINAFLSEYLRNIRRGGTFIKTDKPLPVGTEFFFRLRVPELSDPIVLKGKVQWITSKEKATAEQQAGMGIGFVYESEADRRSTHALVEGLLRAQLGDRLADRMLASA